MPRQTHKGGRYIPPTKGKRAPKKAGSATTAARQSSPVKEPPATRVVAARPNPSPRPSRPSPGQGVDTAGYAYVFTDLKTIGVTAGAMLLILALLAVFIR